MMMLANQTSSSKNAPEADQFMLAEYNALRDEILKRAELQQQILSLTLIIFGTILTFGLQVHSASIILLYPLLSLFLAASWRHDGQTIKKISIYIRDQIEAQIGGNTFGWEHRTRRHQRSQSKFTFLSVKGAFAGGFNFLAARGVFAGTSLLATLLAIPFAKVDVTDLLLFALAIVSIMSSIAMLRYTPIPEITSVTAHGEPAREEEQN
jgi:hypothetical protein